MNVWLLYKYFDAYEAPDFIGVYSTLDKAKDEAQQSEWQFFEGGDVDRANEWWSGDFCIQEEEVL